MGGALGVLFSLMGLSLVVDAPSHEGTSYMTGLGLLLLHTGSSLLFTPSREG
jgi:hypothetical protein